MTALSEARERFVAERPNFEALAEQVASEITRLTRQRGVPCIVTGRAKDVASFVGKCFRKKYTDPWNQVTDKAGVRVIVDDYRYIDSVVQIVKEQYDVKGDVHDWTQELKEADKIGYGGVHVQAKVKGGGALVGAECEIQIRTAAQNVWSEMSHRLLYKPGMPPDLDTDRALKRLAVLMEIFDEEVTRRVDQLMSRSGYRIEELINAAEAAFYRFADTPYDRALSRLVIAEVADCLPAADEGGAYVEALREFTTTNEAKLADIFTRYRDLGAPTLIHQPESIIIFERIFSDPFTLRDEWEDKLPGDELDALEAIWGS
jgi:ppGpp synthetase/RelA/SpoT-type nucleotidyltranferase